MVATTSKDKLMTEAEILAMPEDDYMKHQTSSPIGSPTTPTAS